MHAVLDGHTANVDVIVTARLSLQLQPGAWVIHEGDNDWAVTNLQGVIDAAGYVHFAYPKGVRRRPSGSWGAKEQLLTTALPSNHPKAAWAAVPQAIRDLIEDSYLLARDETPQAIGC